MTRTISKLPQKSAFPHLALDPSRSYPVFSDISHTINYMLRDESSGYMDRKTASVLSDSECSQLIKDYLSKSNSLKITSPSATTTTTNTNTIDHQEDIDYSDVTSSSICVENAPFGLQGMPLFERYPHAINILGLSSWFIDLTATDHPLKSKTRSGRFMVYTRLSAHAKWIRKVTGLKF